MCLEGYTWRRAEQIVALALCRIGAVSLAPINHFGLKVAIDCKEFIAITVT